MKKIALIILILHLFTLSATNICTAQSKPIYNSIDSLLSAYQTEDLPGGAIAIVSEDGAIYTKCFGVMNTITLDKINKSTLFDLASVAKQFTAYAILLLEDQGKIDLDCDIREYIKDLPNYKHTITVRNLLQHTSGIASTDWLRLASNLDFEEEWSHQDEINILKRYPNLNFNPNTKMLYSNGGYSILATIVESVTGLSFEEFLDQNIFSPLGMQYTLVNSNSNTELINSADGYSVANDKATKISYTNDYSYGSGNIWSNLEDMIKWSKNLLNPKVGNREMVERITNKYNTLENGDSINYTYGFFIKNHKGIKIVEHQGGVPGFNNYLTMLPNQKYVIITMFNNQNIAARSIVNNIIEILAPSELIEPKPQEVIEKEINLDIANKISGTYELSDGMELTFKLQNDTLWLTLPLDQKYQLFSQNDSTYFLKAFNAQCSFDIQKNGEINKMIWKQRAIDYHGSRVKERVDITLEDLKSIAGEYIQPHLNIIYSISYQDNKLILNTPSTFKKYLGIDTLDIIHVNGDKFMTSRLGIIYFTRDKQNKIDGFLMRELGRLENVKFEKLNK